MGRSYRASVKGFKQVKTAFYKWGNTQEDLAVAVNCHRLTVVKFFAQKAIDKLLFQAICTELGVDWKKIAELEESESTVESIKNTGKKITCTDSGDTTQVLQSQVSLVENNSNKTHQARIVLSAKLTAHNQAEFEDKKEEVEAILTHLKQLVGDFTLTIQDIQKGSIKITLNGSSEGIEKLHKLFESGKLVEILGIPVENVESLATENTEEDDYKLQLIERIIGGENLGNGLVRANLSGVFLSRANLYNANLQGANLEGANLIQANLEGANLIQANLYNANLIQANLYNANLIQADLEGANLEGANLIQANLALADLEGANLEGANLMRANLKRANLEGANLIQANLEGADLSGAKVEKALFMKTVGLTEDTKQDLKNLGAIFEDSPGDRSEVFAGR